MSQNNKERDSSEGTGSRRYGSSYSTYISHRNGDSAYKRSKSLKRTEEIIASSNSLLSRAKTINQSRGGVQNSEY